jgi:hypothetical protein
MFSRSIWILFRASLSVRSSSTLPTVSVLCRRLPSGPLSRQRNSQTSGPRLRFAFLNARTDTVAPSSFLSLAHGRVDSSYTTLHVSIKFGESESPLAPFPCSHRMGRQYACPCHPDDPDAANPEKLCCRLRADIWLQNPPTKLTAFNALAINIFHFACPALQCLAGPKMKHLNCGVTDAERYAGCLRTK